MADLRTGLRGSAELGGRILPRRKCLKSCCCRGAGGFDRQVSADPSQAGPQISHRMPPPARRVRGPPYAGSRRCRVRGDLLVGAEHHSVRVMKTRVARPWSRSSFCRGGESSAARRSWPRCASTAEVGSIKIKIFGSRPSTAAGRNRLSLPSRGPGRVRRSGPASLITFQRTRPRRRRPVSAVSACSRLTVHQINDGLQGAGKDLARSVADHDPDPVPGQWERRRDRRGPDSRPTSAPASC